MHNPKALITQVNTMTGHYYEASGSQKKINKKETSCISRKPDGLFSCLQCDYTNKQKGNVLLHMQSVHEGKVYCCDMCGYKASKAYHLIRHVRSVHKKIRYKCRNCDYQATDPSTLRTHTKNKHEGMTYIQL